MGIGQMLEHARKCDEIDAMRREDAEDRDVWKRIMAGLSVGATFRPEEAASIADESLALYRVRFPRRFQQEK